MADLVALVLVIGAVMGMAQAGGCRVANVSAGSNLTCAAFQDGSARCWGKLGEPNTGPPMDFGAGRSVVQLAAHDDFACALLDDHTVSCWGGNSGGQLGLGDTQNRDQPTQVQVGTGNQAIQLISTGSTASHTCAVASDGGVFCWGDARELQGTPWLGQPNSKNISGTQVILPRKVGLGSDSLTVIDMCAGDMHTCVLTAQLGLKCWGLGPRGQLGLGNLTDTTGLTGLNLPPVNLGTGRSAVQISCGAFHTCAVLDNGLIRCFGWNTYGQLGYGDNLDRGAKDTDMGDSLPLVDVGKGQTVKQVSGGSEHTCALLDNGQVKCWGGNSDGRLGHHCNNQAWGDSTGQMGDSLPAVDLGPGRTAVSITAGRFQSCAVLDDGSVKCWGDKAVGQLSIRSNIATNVCEVTDLGISCASSTGE